MDASVRRQGGFACIAIVTWGLTTIRGTSFGRSL